MYLHRLEAAGRVSLFILASSKKRKNVLAGREFKVKVVAPILINFFFVIWSIVKNSKSKKNGTFLLFGCIFSF